MPELDIQRTEEVPILKTNRNVLSPIIQKSKFPLYPFRHYNNCLNIRKSSRASAITIMADLACWCNVDVS